MNKAAKIIISFSILRNPFSSLFLTFIPNGRGCYKKGDICGNIIQDQSITMLFIAMSYFSKQSDGQVSLVSVF